MDLKGLDSKKSNDLFIDRLERSEAVALSLYLHSAERSIEEVNEHILVMLTVDLVVRGSRAKQPDRIDGGNSGLVTESSERFVAGIVAQYGRRCWWDNPHVPTFHE